MLNIWFFLALLAAGLDWMALWLKRLRLNFVTKPAALFFLILWFSSLGGWQAASVWFGLALVFSLIGDIFLLLPEKYALLGLFAFLAAQIGYVIGFSPQSPVDTLPLVLIGLPVLLAGSLVYNNLRKNLEKNPAQQKLANPILIYYIAASLMLFSSLLTLAQPYWKTAAAILVASGSALFFTSDALLFNNRLIHPIPNGRLLVRISYHLGQIGLVAGILLNFLG
jgi:uncharacterized membrane protein YhhN